MLSGLPEIDLGKSWPPLVWPGELRCRPCQIPAPRDRQSVIPARAWHRAVRRHATNDRARRRAEAIRLDRTIRTFGGTP